MFCIFFLELMSNFIFGLFFKFTCLFFLLVAILNCTNLVTFLFRVIVLVVYTGFICDKNITLPSVVMFTLYLVKPSPICIYYAFETTVLLNGKCSNTTYISKI